MDRDPGQLAELAALREIRIAEIPFAVVLIAHESAASSGQLRARRGPVDKRVLLERGAPVDCRSNLLHETLSRYLVSLGRISAEQAEECLSKSIARGSLFGEVLVEEGLIEAPELTRLLQQNLAKKLLDLFTWPDGEVSFDATPQSSPSPLKVRVPQLVLTGITRFMPQSSIDRAVGRLAGELLVRDPSGDELASGLKLAERESEVLAALARPQRIEELMATGGLGAPELARSLYALLVLGLVAPRQRLEARRAAAPAPTAEAPAPAPKIPPAPTPSKSVAVTDSAARRSELLNRVSQAFLDHRQKDPFELLDVDEEAGDEEVQRRFLDYARDFAPWRFEEPGLRLVEDYARELFLAGAAAYGKLADPSDRSELRVRRRLEREESERAARAAQFRIETDLLDPAIQFRKGMTLKNAGKLKAALQELEFAADCDPQNGTYRAEAAHTRYLFDPSAMARRALEELEEAQRVDPGAPEAFLYHGEIAAELGRAEAAEASLRRAARLLGPDDRRALDALHALAKTRKKRR